MDEALKTTLYSKPVVIAAILSVATIIGLAIYMLGSQYTTQKSGEVAMYKTSRITGKTFFVRGVEETEVSSAESKKKDSKWRNATLREISKIHGWGKVDSHDWFDGDIYNGNENIVITEITYEISDESVDGFLTEPRRYTDTETIQPYTTENIRFKISKASRQPQYSWKIVAAKCRDVK